MGTPADVLLIGLGGLGCPVVAGLSQTHPELRWIICDGDVVDRSNLARQWLYDEADVGRRKTDVVARRLQHVEVMGSVQRSQLPGLVQSARVVIDASDDVELKFALNDAAVRAQRRFVIGGITGLDGFVLARSQRACLRCVFESPTDDMRRTCAEAGVLAPGPAMVGAVMAHAVGRLLGEPAFDAFWSFSLRAGRSRMLSFDRALHCVLHDAEVVVSDAD